MRHPSTPPFSDPRSTTNGDDGPSEEEEGRRKKKYRIGWNIRKAKKRTRRMCSSVKQRRQNCVKEQMISFRCNFRRTTKNRRSSRQRSAAPTTTTQYRIKKELSDSKSWLEQRATLSKKPWTNSVRRNPDWISSSSSWKKSSQRLKLCLRNIRESMQ